MIPAPEALAHLDFIDLCIALDIRPSRIHGWAAEIDYSDEVDLSSAIRQGFQTYHPELNDYAYLIIDRLYAPEMEMAAE